MQNETVLAELVDMAWQQHGELAIDAENVHLNIACHISVLVRISILHTFLQGFDAICPIALEHQTISFQHRFQYFDWDR